MKLTKTKLKELVREEIKNLKENARSDAEEVIAYWEKSGFSTSYLKNSKYIKSAIKQWQTMSGEKVDSRTAREIKTIVMGDKLGG